MSTATLAPPRANLDECRVCHQRVTDYEDGGYEREDGQRGHFACDATKTYRVVDLTERKTIATGLSLTNAHRFIEQTRARNPQARFDIRTEIAS